MAVLSSKARAQLAVDSFEQDLRHAIDAHLLDHLAPQSVFSGEYDELVDRRAKDDFAELGSLTPYLFLRQAYDVLLRWVSVLPADLGALLKTNVGSLDAFVGVRNRVMHGRPLRPDDLELTEAFVGRFRSRHFPQTASALTRLKGDRGWQPAPEGSPQPVERILHNLPSADFDETGLLGRDQQVKELTSMLTRRRERMITLTGEGGIGKTALALEACYALLDDQDSPFEAILWISLKSERLTAYGVQELSDAIKDIPTAASVLGEAIDVSFVGSTQELARAIEGITALIVIDNLETAQGNEVISLYDALPDSVSFLFTSRVGVGQIERRVAVAPLDEKSAALLFRKFARSRGLASLAAASDPELHTIVDQLRYSPLAIRWYILSVEAGRTPSDALRDQTQLLQFCVANVVDGLSSDARLVLAVLRALDRSVSFDELAVISDLEIDSLRRGAQNLAQGSLLLRSHSAGAEESQTLGLSSTARAFLPAADEMDIMEDVIRRETAYNQDRERSRIAADRGRYLDDNVVFERSPLDAPTAHLLRIALRHERGGRSAAAAAALTRARTLNPGYFEVDRVDAFLSSTRKETARATSLYRSAIGLCQTEEERSWVGFFFAGHLARRAFDLPTAIALSEKAHTIFGSYDSALQLGNFYVWDHRFPEGLKLIRDALVKAPAPRFAQIATTSLVECMRRWSEADLEDRRWSSAMERAIEGVTTGLELVDASTADQRMMRSIVDATTAAIKAAHHVREIDAATTARLRLILDRLRSDARFFRADRWRHLINALGSLSADVRRDLNAETLAIDVVERVADGRPVGSIIQLKGTYGFLAHPDFPSNLFFHGGLLRPPLSMSELEIGAIVEFSVGSSDTGQDQAHDVCLVGTDLIEPSPEPNGR